MLRLRTGPEALDGLEGPAMATVKFSTFVDHWVVVRKLEGERVVVGDPLRGVVRLTRAEFRQRWRGALLSAPLAE